MKNKKLLIILSSIVLFILIIVGIYFLGYKTTVKRGYKDFYNQSIALFEIPGLDTNYVPQAIAYNEENNVFLIAGYDSEDEPSYLYVLDENGKEIKKVAIKTDDDTYYTGHAGGVISFNDIIFVSSGKKVYKLSLEKVLNNDIVIVDAVTKVDVSGATMFVYDNYLFVTEFYEETKYQTDESHHLTTPSNNANKALAFAYEIDENSESGLKSNEAKMVLSIPEKVQGIIIKDDELVISQSFGRFNDSSIKTYNNILLNETEYTFNYNDLDLPLYYLDDSSLVDDLHSPSMTEGVCLYNNKVLVIFESSAKKYKFTCKCPIDEVYMLE